MFEKMTHANFRLPKPTEFPARHPFRNEKNHQKLLEYLQQRLMLGKNARDERLPRIGRIDRDVAGWIIRTDETEVERERKKTQTGQPVAMDQNLPLTRSEEHTSELQSLIRISYAGFCLKKKTKK